MVSVAGLTDSSSSVQAYTYDTPIHADDDDHTELERGPPAIRVDFSVSAVQATVDRRSRRTLAGAATEHQLQ